MKENCDDSKCNGPLRYYKDLGCKPVYAKEGDCCPVKYDCSHLENRSPDKCYVNNKEYEPGEALRPEDANRCDVGCFCSNNTEPASFVCAIVDCYFGPVPTGCFLRYTQDKCCPERICLRSGETKATCTVDGKVYEEGDYFQPESDPELNCNCMPGYEGKNVEPFCKKLNRPSCSADFRNPDLLTGNCAPVYYDSQNPATDCSVSSRCQTPEDAVVHTHDDLTSAEESESDVCRFGTLKLHLGDTLQKVTGTDDACVNCVCDVPPYLTCKRLSHEECQ